MLEKQQKRFRRKARVRAKISGIGNRPRLCVFRSNKHIYAQLIDDEKGRTLITASDLELKQKTRSRKHETKTEQAGVVGELIAKKALERKIEKVVFDKGGYAYRGRVKTLAEGARKGGLIF